MKKQFILIAVAALAFTSVSCNKEEVYNENEAVGANSTSIAAVWDEDDATKANVTTAGKYTWTANTDKVAYRKDGAWAQSDGAQTGGAATTSFGINDLNRDCWAVYPYSIIENAPNKTTKYGQSGTALNVYLPKVYALGDTDLESNGDVHLCSPMIADNSKPLANGWTFKQLCGLFRMTVNCIPPSVNKITVDFGHPVAGSFDIPAGVTPGTSAIAYANAAGDNSNIVTITFDAGTSWRDEVTFNLPWPTGEYGDIVVKMYNGSTEVISMTRPAGKTGNYTAARAHGRKVIAGFPIFSVDATRRVVIAKSNLQFTRNASLAGTAWTMAQGTWSFMTNPWDKIETGSVSENYINETAISLFGWGTTGYDWAAAGLASQYGAKSYPWSTAENKSESEQFGPIWGNASGVNDMTGVFKNGDWGYAAAADLADGREWRILTSIEWKNLLAMTDVENEDDDSPVCSQRKLHYGKGVVNGMRGLIILPDYFVDPKTNQGTKAFIKAERVHWSNNTYTSTDWVAMDAAGAVFLPITGARLAGRSLVGEENGLYISSSTAYSKTNLWSVYAVPNKIWARQYNSEGRHVGRPVRLVYTIE